MAMNLSQGAQAVARLQGELHFHSGEFRTLDAEGHPDHDWAFVFNRSDITPKNALDLNRIALDGYWAAESKAYPGKPSIYKP